MIPPKYADVLKPANDLFSKDFPTGIDKVEIKTRAANGTEFNVNGTLNKSSGAINAEFSGKYIDKVNNFTFNEKFNTANILTLELETENSFAQGLKLTAVGTTSLVSSKKSLKSEAFYKQNNLFAHASANLLNDIVVSSDVVVAQGEFAAGADISYDLNKSVLKSSNVLAAHITKDYITNISTSNMFNNLSVSIFQRVKPGVLDMAVRANYDLSKSENAVKAEVAAKYSLDKTSFVKAKIANDGNLGLAYSQVLTPGITLTTAAQIDLNGLSENKHKIGSSLLFQA